MDMNDLLNTISLPDISRTLNESLRPKIPDLYTPPIKIGPTVQDRIAEQTECLVQMNEKQFSELNAQTALLKDNCSELTKQTDLLKDNYSQLEGQTKMLTNQYRELFGIYQHLQDESAGSKKELVKSKRFNYISMGISILAVIVATCAWLFPRGLGG